MDEILDQTIASLSEALEECGVAKAPTDDDELIETKKPNTATFNDSSPTTNPNTETPNIDDDLKLLVLNLESEDIDVDQVIESLLKGIEKCTVETPTDELMETKEPDTTTFSDSSPFPEDTDVQNPKAEAIDDNELVKLKIKDINKKFKHLPKAKIWDMKYRRRILKNRNYKHTSRKKQITKTPALGHKIASWSTRQTDRPQLDQTIESLYVDNTKATKTEEAKVPTDELIETKETNTDTYRRRHRVTKP